MVFVDTGGWIAVAVTSDSLHELALNYYLDLVAKRVRLFISNYILDETLTRIRYDFGHTQASAFARSTKRQSSNSWSRLSG